MDADFLLLHRMKNGDEQAIEDFVRKYYPAILRYCHLHTRDTGCAEDLTQETFARFFRTFKNYQHYGKAANYLYVIAGNLCRDFYKKSDAIPMDTQPLSETLPPVSPMENLHLQLDIRHAVQNLPPDTWTGRTVVCDPNSPGIMEKPQLRCHGSGMYHILHHPFHLCCPPDVVCRR